jgi:hypothetical protein
VAGPLGSYGETLDMMNASIARMGLVFVTLASLGGCSACGPKFPKDKPPQIASVYITPKQPTVTADWPVSFKAVALSTDGVRFDPLHYDDEGYTILWEVEGVPGVNPAGGPPTSGPVGVAMDAKDKNPVEVMATDPNLGEFILRVTISYKKSKYLDSVVIKVIDPDLLAAEDRVHVKWTPGLAAVMLNGCELNGSAAPVSRAETHWELFEASLMSPLGKNYTEEDCAREAEFSIAAPFQRLILYDKTSSGQPQSAVGQWPAQLWTDASGEELDASGAWLWLPPDTVDLYVHNYTGTSDISLDMVVQLNIANKVYGESRVGIGFRIVEYTNTTFGQENEPVGSCRESYVSGGIPEGGLGVDIASTRLNVVVLKGSLPQGSHGWACRAFENHPGRLIFLNWSDIEVAGGLGGPKRPALLAHELGHVLANDRPRLAFRWEHVGDPNGPFEGFQKSNVMHPKVTGIPRDHLTVGQGFRMNVDPTSWYQKEPGIKVRHSTRDCGQAPYCSDLCPPLQRDVDEIPVKAGTCPPSSSSGPESDS